MISRTSKVLALKVNEILFRSLSQARPRRMDIVMKLRLENAHSEKPKSNVHFNRSKWNTRYSLPEVLNALKAFDIWRNETLTLELKVNMGDKKNRLQHLRGTMLLPYDHGRKTIVLALAEGKFADEAKEFGADIVGGEELIPLIKAGELHFDQCVCTLDFLPKLKDMQNILRRKMPNVKRGSATDDLRPPIDLFKKGITYEADREGRVEVQIGKVDYPVEKLTANIVALMKEILQQGSVPTDEFYQSVTLKGDWSPQFLVEADRLL